MEALFEKDDFALKVFERLDGQSLLEHLQVSPFHEVYKLASDMLERFFAFEVLEGEEKEEFLRKNQVFLV